MRLTWTIFLLASLALADEYHPRSKGVKKSNEELTEGNKSNSNYKARKVTKLFQALNFGLTKGKMRLKQPKI